MWLPKHVYDLFQVSKENVDQLKQEVAKLSAENAVLRVSEATAKANFDWLRIRVNQLEVERAQLVKRAYNIDVPVPEVVRSNQRAGASDLLQLTSALFEDVGEAGAKELGLPTFG
jgi:hypothetical protein